jgi:ribonuclease D
MVTKPTPTREEMALLPAFDGVILSDIVVPATEIEAQAAYAALLTAAVIGFDTESKPTFKAGEVSTGPHIVQLATLQKTYVLQLHHPFCVEISALILQHPKLIKVGFGLKSDYKQLKAKFGIEPQAVIDVDGLFKAQGYVKSIGVKTAVALLFGQCFKKSKSISTSNWSQPNLNPSQLLYAANDAYAALRVYQALTQSTTS